jgi:uncharacterized protein DUF4380
LGARPGPAPGTVLAITHEPFLGWTDAYRMSNGHAAVSVVPAAGGRVLEFSLDGRQALWVNPALQGKLFPVPKRPTNWNDWRNYGGYKLWPAPESLWPKRVGDGPDPFLDGGAASVEVLSQRGLRLTGAPSVDMGLLFVRELEMNPQTGALTVQQRLRNISPRPVDWSIWDVTQIPALVKKGSPAGGGGRVPAAQREGDWRAAPAPGAGPRAFAPRRVFDPAWVFFPANPTSPHRNGILPLGAGQDQWKNEGGLIITEYQGVSGKIGADSPAGWMVGVAGDLAYIKRFPPRRAGATYPDKGSTVEVYTSDKTLPYIEMEVLGPVVRLAPGEETSYPETWALAKLSHPIRQRADVPAAVVELRERGLLP